MLVGFALFVGLTQFMSQLTFKGPFYILFIVTVTVVMSCDDP